MARSAEVIAIDGPSGVGKSTVARLVASALGFEWLDTGATYRLAALLAARSGLVGGVGEGGSMEALGRFLKRLRSSRIDFVAGRAYLDGEDVTEQLHDEHVADLASRLAAIPEVRQVLVEVQQAWIALHQGVVAEGRDVGTVVAPGAALKVFLTADPAVRASRRARQAGIDREEAMRAISARDLRDATREVSPLRPAEDSVVIDTSEMSAEEVAEKIMELFRARALRGTTPESRPHG